MGKVLRKAQARLEARKLATISIRKSVASRNSKIPVELAYKMPGSMTK